MQRDLKKTLYKVLHFDETSWVMMMMVVTIVSGINSASNNNNTNINSRNNNKKPSWLYCFKNRLGSLFCSFDVHRQRELLRW